MHTSLSRPGPFLNWDILDLVCRNSHDRQTLVSMSETCSVLRRSAVQRLLSMRPIWLKDERSIRLFHRFASADPTHRYPYVRSIRIKIFGIEPEARQEISQHLVDIIQHSTRLKTMFFHYWDAIRAHLDAPRVEAAIRGLTSLRRIALYFWDDNIVTLLRQMQSPIQHLDVGPISEIEWGPDWDETVSFSRLEPLIGPFAATVEGLSLSCVYLHPSSGLQFPRVCSLEIGTYAGRPTLDVLLRMFPGLSGGSLTIGSHISDAGDALDEEAVQSRVRRENRDHREERLWTHLDRLSSDDPVGIYLLGLTCPVRLLDLGCGPSWTEEPHAVEVLRDTRPCCLRLSTWVSDNRHVFIDPVPPEVAQRMTHLFLHLALLMPSDDAVSGNSIGLNCQNVAALLGRVIEVLRSTRLTHLHLNITCDPIEENGQLSGYFMTEVLVLDINAYAAQFARALPNLRLVALTLEPYAIAHIPALSRGWRVSRGKAAAQVSGASTEEPVVEALGGDALRQVLEDEELDLDFPN